MNASDFLYEKYGIAVTEHNKLPVAIKPMDLLKYIEEYAALRQHAINKSKMENKKQSSVEWLFVELWNTPKDKFDWQSIFEQAKAMHKDEIEEAYMVGNHSEMRGGKFIFEVTEKYYEQTFGGQDNEN